MLINALLILFTEVLLIIYGMATVRILHLVLPELFSTYEKISFPILAVLGLISSTFIAAVVALFAPIQWIFQLVLFLAIILYAILDRQWMWARIRKINKISLRLDFYLLLLFSLITALVLATSADVNRAYDDGLFHLQSVLLITKHAAVPGIGLLNHHLATTSIWHVTGALWGYQILHPDHMVYFIATPLLMLNFLLYLFHNHRLEKNRYLQWASLLLLIAAIFYMVYYRFDFGSVGSDIPSYIMTWLTMLVLIQIFSHSDAPEDTSRDSVLFILFAVFAWAIQLSTLMLIIPALYLATLLFKQNPKETIHTLLISISLLMTDMAKSLISSGYFIYPPLAKLLGISFKWQIPYEMVLKNRLEEMSWAKLPGASTESVTVLSLQEWAPQWFHLLDKYQQYLIVIVFAITLFYTITFVLKRKDLLKYNRLVSSVILNIWMYASLIYWFFAFPDPKFLYGPAMVILALGMLSFSLWVPERYRVNYPMLTRQSVTTTILVIAFLFIHFHILSEINYSGIRVVPAKIPQIEVQQMEQNGLTLNLPVDGNQCWGEAVPCVPYPCSENVYLIGDTLYNGLMYSETMP